MGKANEQIILRAIEESDMECMIDLLTNDIIKKTYMVPDFASREEAERLARRFVDQLCGGSISAFASALCDGALSKQEIDQLRKLLEEDRL